MATTETVTVASTGRASTHNTLDGSAADTVTVSVPSTVGMMCSALLKNRSAGDIWFRYDGTTAVAAADGTYHLGPGEVFQWQNLNGSIAVSLIATSALAYSVQVMPKSET